MSKGNYPVALSHHLQALKIREELGDKKGIAISYNNIGNIYWNQGNNDEALAYHLKALKIREDIEDKSGMSGSYNNNGIIYIEKSNYPEALKYFLKSIDVKEKMGDKLGSSTAYNNVGVVYGIQKKYDEAFLYYKKSLKIREDIGDKDGIANSNASIGHLLALQGKNKEARICLLKAHAISLQAGNKRHVQTGYMRLAALDSAAGDYKSAFENFKLSAIYADSLKNEANTKKIVEDQMNYEFEKKETIAKHEQEKKEAVAEAEKKKQKIITWSVVGILILVLTFAVFAYRSYLQKQKANKLLDEKNILLRKKNEAISQQKILVEEKNRLITDSIEYAKSIQDAILPSDELIKESLPESFILFAQKDVVSGDFYWMNSPPNNYPNEGRDESPLCPSDISPTGENISSEEYLFAAVDCTGHGVPGAFMSLMAFNILENIVTTKRIKQPSLILDKLNTLVVETLHQHEENASTKYGMDISLISINRKTNKLEFAGAHNPLIIIRAKQPSPFEGGVRQGRTGDVTELKADKTTIGMAQQKFTNHTVELQKNDMLYMFTAGYADQKGGPNNKKFFAATFRELLVSVSNEKAEVQKQMLLQKFTDWKGNS